ncbi:MAG: MBL fold metallo-hydrolase [Pseudomonadota bacterium]
MTAEFDPPIGTPEELEAGLRRIVAPNPSPMTFRGTNTYILGTGGLAVIDPGPDSSEHIDAILQAVRPGQTITHIIATHSHRDHSPAAGPLSVQTGAPVYAFGDAMAGRSEVMQRLAANGLESGGEGVDHSFAPDINLQDGTVVKGDGWALDVIHTPGHLGNHICLGWQDVCLTADHVMGWATSLVSPPDGDLSDFMASCERLLGRAWRVFYPGHGAPVTDPHERLIWLMDHRRAREAAILNALEAGGQSVSAVTRRVYTDIPAALLSAAERNVLAHLIDLYGKSRVACDDISRTDAEFRLSPSRHD